MTKRLEEFFNVDSVDTNESVLPVEVEEQVKIEEPKTSVLVIREQLSIAERIDEALPEVKGLEVDDRAFDEYADKAMESYDRLMDLGFNVDDRNAGKIFEVASTMMGNAITAKTAKLEKKLKMVQLQLQAAKLANSMPKEKEEEADGELTTDRNAILNIINQNLKNKQ